MALMVKSSGPALDPIPAGMHHAVCSPPSGECEHNARLIAAAPEMLTALKGILAWYAALPESGLVAGGLELSARLREAREAIAKAEGAQ